MVGLGGGQERLAEERGVLSREHGGTFRVGRPVRLPWGLHPVCSVGSGAAEP